MTSHGLLIRPNGQIEVDSQAVERLAERSGRYELAMSAPGFLVLRKDGGEGSLERLLMGGEIVSRMSVMEIINVIVQANWRGDLYVGGVGVQRMLGFDQGALRYARSNAPEDTLAEVMHRLGAIERAQKTALQKEAQDDRSFGQLCIARGIVEPQALFDYLHKQAEQVFFGTLLVSDGWYAFGLPEDTVSPPSAAVHLSVQGLLMEGVQRIDEMALFRERIPSLEACPVATPRTAPDGLEDRAREIFLLCDGRRSIEDLARLSGFGEFATVKSVYQLLQRGAVTLQASRNVEESAVRPIVGAFNDMMRDICLAVATYGALDEVVGALRGWVDASPHAFLKGCTIHEDGSLETAEVVDGLKKVPTESPLDQLNGALHEYLAFGLFSAGRLLPVDQERVLARDVRRQLDAIRF